MRFFNTIYLLLLVYTIAALVFWGYSLHKQSEHIYELQFSHLRSNVDSASSPEVFNEQLTELNSTRASRIKQYLGEGGTFLVVIFIGAAIVYSSFQKSIRLSRQQNNFMLAVTHELKSPIAAMKLNLQTLEKYQLDEEKRIELLSKSIKETNRLNDLCDNMLLASQMEGGQHKATKEKLDFTEIAKSSARKYDNRYPERIITQIDKEENVVNGDRLMLQIAVNNLLENAIKYSPPPTAVHVRLFNKDNKVCLQVIDQGIGIPDSEKQKIFKKFYRVGNENTRKSKGTGLGLYLTHKIVKQHNGKISVSDNDPSGSIFELVLPLA